MPNWLFGCLLDDNKTYHTLIEKLTKKQLSHEIIVFFPRYIPKNIFYQIEREREKEVGDNLYKTVEK